MSRSLPVHLFALLAAAGCAHNLPQTAEPAQRSALAAGPANYRVVKRLAVGGEGRWDLFAIDARTHRLYVPRSDRVLAIDAESGAVLGQVTGTKGVHGVALVPELNRGFSSNGQDGSMTVFALDTMQALGKVKAGANPDAILYDPASRRILCFNGKSEDVTAVDANVEVSRLAATSTLKLPGKPELAVADGTGQVFVNLEDKNEVIRIDTKSMQVTARWPLAPGAEPTGLALDAEHHRLFAACHNKMMVVLDAETGRVLATPPIGEGVDGAEFDPATGTAFASNGEGTLSVVRETSPGVFETVETVATQKSARTMTLDPSTHRVYLPAAEFGPAPAATPEQPRPRPAMVPGTFVILVVDG